MNTFPVLCFAYQAVKLLVSLWKTYVVRQYRFLFHWLIYSICILSKCRHPEIHSVWLTELTANTLDCVRNVMAHAQKPDFVFRRNGRVHLNRRGRQFSRLLVVEVCASAVVMLDTPSSKVVCRVLATHSIRQFPLHFPSLASPCAITFHIPYEGPKNTLIAGKACRHSV